VDGCSGCRALVVQDERSGISQSAVGVCPSGGSANGCRSTTWLLGDLDVETCPSLRTSVQPASTAFCETTPGYFLGEAAFWPASTAFCETTPGYFLGEAAFWPASTAFCETLLPNGLNIRMRFFIASASTRFCETLKRGCDYSQLWATVTFILSAEDTYSHCQPPFCELGGQRSPSLQASRWHYTVAHKFSYF
jgi:hypothetical protein